MEEAQGGIVLARTLDRLKHCADGRQSKICLTSRESYEVCAYIWWLTDMYLHAKAKEGKDEKR